MPNILSFWLWVQSLGAYRLFLLSLSAGDASEGTEKQRSSLGEEAKRKGGEGEQESRGFCAVATEMLRRGRSSDIRGKGAEEAKENPLPLLCRVLIGPDPVSSRFTGDAVAEEMAQQRRLRSRGEEGDGEEEGDGALERHGADGTEERRHGREKAKGSGEQRTAQLRFPLNAAAAAVK
ncbi:unnamed protein product [Closterium sp. Yama58-4]|nr:unnamed protein product [Closterium sp. Yama58-4]